MTNNIKTQYDDALAVLNNKPLADKLARKAFANRVGKSETSDLIIKAQTRKCPSCDADMSTDEVDCPECGKMVGKAGVQQVPLPEEMIDKAETEPIEDEVAEGDMPSEEVEDVIEDEPKGKKKEAMQTEAMPEMMMGKHLPGKHNQQSHAGDKSAIAGNKYDLSADDIDDSIDNEGMLTKKMIADGDDTSDFKVSKEARLAFAKEKTFLSNALVQGEKHFKLGVGNSGRRWYLSKNGKDWRKAAEMQADFFGDTLDENTKFIVYKSDVVDSLMNDASEALEVVQKAINAPGGNKGELLAQAATLVNAIRDYAHSIAGAPEVAGAVTAEAVAATQDLNPAPQPGQQVGGNQPVVAEDEVKENPQVGEDQEEAVESPEDDAAETPEDEAEEGRLHFAKQPNEQNKKKAMKPPTPVGERVKARTLPNAVVKSAAMHPTEAFLNKWATTLVPALKSATLSRSAKREAVQKALNEFGPAVVKLIDDVTPVTEDDLTVVVQTEVNKALAEKDSQYQAIVEQLQQQVAVLNAAITSREVKANLPAQRVRKSLPAISPQVPAQAALETHVLSGDQTPIRRFTAAEIAKSSVSAGNQIIRY